jgi:4-diphosphocytidyl-2-C-methyl-D-erythritol kinase
MFVKQVSATQIVIGAPAKINLFLEILNRRPDGFHNLRSAFQAVSLFDRISFELQPEVRIDLEAIGEFPVPTDERNLVTRAFHLMQSRFSLKSGLKVQLEKLIPVGGGLGGGSSDAAATVFACNLLYRLKLTKVEMMSLGAELGSDVPFFFTRGQGMVTGRGEIIEELELPIDYWLRLVTPDLGIGTAGSYAALKRGLTHPDSGFTLTNRPSREELVASLQLTGNDFERTHLKSYPILDRVRTALLDSGALMVRMSGSGSTFFGIYGKAPAVDGSFDAEATWHVEEVRPVVVPY